RAGFHEQTRQQKIGIEESVAIFRHTIKDHQMQRHAAETFRHSGETISRHCHKVINALCYLDLNYIRPPDFNRYHSLPPHSIWKWQQLRSAFRSHFIGAQVCLVPKESLANVTQIDDESVKEYIARFNDRVQNMEPCHPETLLVMAIAGLKPNSIFCWTLCQNKPNTFQEFLARAQQHIIAEEAMSVPDFNFNPNSRGLKQNRSPRPMQITVHRVNTNSSRGTSSRRQVKAYARQAYNSGKQVFTTDLRDVLNARNCPITFNMEDANHFGHPHSDALVITVPICGIPVHRVMVDTGAYSSILMLKAFDKMG
ncbi:Unknown protein, partial [Striga hermonthica]